MFTDFEVICIDDGSTDESSSILSEFVSENTSNTLMLMIICILTLYRYYMKQQKGQRPIL